MVRSMEISQAMKMVKKVAKEMRMRMRMRTMHDRHAPIAYARCHDEAVPSNSF